MAAPEELAERVTRTGASFFAFGHPGDAGLGPIWARLREVSSEEAGGMVIREIFAGACARTAFPGLLETMKAWRPEVVVRESQEYAAVLATEMLGIRRARVAITAQASEASILPHAAPAVDALRGELGLAPDPAGLGIAREARLTLFPSALDEVGTEARSTRRFRVERKPPAELPDWWPERTGPLVYATLGTMAGAMQEMRSAYAVVLEAVAGLEARVLLTTGAELGPDVLGAVPENVHVERFVPQDDVMPHAAVVLFHGGSGTLLGALAAGAPLVVMPMFADQPLNAERVAELGVGLALPVRAATALEVRKALRSVLEEPRFRERARELASEMAALPAVNEAPLMLEELSRGGIW